jgi:hypothetical protein
MKPLDLEAALAGAPVQTRNGDPARILCFDRATTRYPIVALVLNPVDGDEGIYTYTPEGRYLTNRKSNHDLVMAPVKKRGWINIYKAASELNPFAGAVYPTEEDALAEVDVGHVATVPVEWED